MAIRRRRAIKQGDGIITDYISPISQKLKNKFLTVKNYSKNVYKKIVSRLARDQINELNERIRAQNDLLEENNETTEALRRGLKESAQEERTLIDKLNFLEHQNQAKDHEKDLYKNLWEKHTAALNAPRRKKVVNIAENASPSTSAATVNNLNFSLPNVEDENFRSRAEEFYKKKRLKFHKAEQNNYVPGPADSNNISQNAQDILKLIKEHEQKLQDTHQQIYDRFNKIEPQINSIAEKTQNVIAKNNKYKEQANNLKLATDELYNQREGMTALNYALMDALNSNRQEAIIKARAEAEAQRRRFSRIKRVNR